MHTEWTRSNSVLTVLLSYSVNTISFHPRLTHPVGSRDTNRHNFYSLFRPWRLWNQTEPSNGKMSLTSFQQFTCRSDWEKMLSHGEKSQKLAHLRHKNNIQLTLCRDSKYNNATFTGMLPAWLPHSGIQTFCRNCGLRCSSPGHSSIPEQHALGLGITKPMGLTWSHTYFYTQ